MRIHCCGASGAAKPVAFIENGTPPRERVIVTTLAEVAAGLVEVSNPAVMVAGDVIRQREQFLQLTFTIAAV